MEPERSSRNAPPADRDCVADTIRQIVARTADVPVDQVHDNDNLETDLGCDSLDLVEITMAIEEEYDLSVSDDYAEKFHTVGQIVDGVVELLQRRTEPTTTPT